MLRRRLAFAALVVFTLLAVDVRLFTMAARRGTLARAMTEFPDRGIWYPDYPRFLDAVRARTRPGDAIALVVPPVRWNEGYMYAYYRASYSLAGRQVLPLVTPDDRIVPENLFAARYVAAWMRNPPPRHRPVWSGHRGVLSEH